jgi:hypothetical protein
MHCALVIAQSHGPGQHGGILVIALAAIALVAWLVYLVRNRARKESGNGSDRDPERDRGAGR